MNERLIRFILFALFAGVVLGAGSVLLLDRTHSPGAAPAAYFPVHDGMQWRYAGFGNEFAAYTAEVTDRDGSRAQVVATSGAHVASVYDVSEERVIRVVRRAEVEPITSFLDAPAEEAYVVIQGPLKVGRTWFAQGGETAADARESAADGAPRQSREIRRIEAIGGTVTTPAGTFRNVLTIYVERPGLTDSREHYALGIGLVRSEFLAEEPVISELAVVRVGREPFEPYLSKEEALGD